MTLFEQALVMHLIGDWLLQNDWMARHKSSLRHPASWIHSGIHTVLLTLVLGWQAGLFLGLTHLIVDTRIPQRWWSGVFRQTTSGPMGDHVRIWGDQVIHISMLALWFVIQPHL